VVSVIIEPDELGMSRRTARLIANAIHARPRLTMCLAAGRTQVHTYEILAGLCSEKALSFREVTIFEMDEYLGLDPDSPHTLRRLLWDSLIRRVDIDQARFHSLDSATAHPLAEASLQERRIREAGGLDLLLLGIGVNGHIGFNEPGSPVDSRTRCIDLTPETIRQNACMFGENASVPRHALSMGVGTFLDARQILLSASGLAKAEAVRRALCEPPSAAIPASALQSHTDCTFILDSDAASLLPSR